MMIGMRETHERCAVLADEDEGTFVRFTHWAYAGFYNAAECSGRVRDEAEQKTTEKLAGGNTTPSLHSAILTHPFP